MQNVKLALDAWRDAVRRRDRLAVGSAAWQNADDDVRRAATVFHAELAQVSAQYAEEAYEDRDSWASKVGRRASEAGGSMADAALAGPPR